MAAEPVGGVVIANYISSEVRLLPPVNDTDPATKLYVDQHSGGGGGGPPQVQIVYFSKAGPASGQTADGLTLATAYNNFASAASDANAYSAVHVAPARVVIYCADAGAYTISTTISLLDRVDVYAPCATLTGAGSLAINEWSDFICGTVNLTGGISVTSYTPKVTDICGRMRVSNLFNLTSVSSDKRYSIEANLISVNNVTVNSANLVTVYAATSFVPYNDDPTFELSTQSEGYLLIHSNSVNPVIINSSTNSTGSVYLYCTTLGGSLTAISTGAIYVSCYISNGTTTLSGNVYFSNPQTLVDGSFVEKTTLAVNGLWGASNIDIPIRVWRVGKYVIMFINAFHLAVDSGRTGAIAATDAFFLNSIMSPASTQTVRVQLWLNDVYDWGTLSVPSSGAITLYYHTNSDFDFSLAGGTIDFGTIVFSYSAYEPGR